MTGIADHFLTMSELFPPLLFLQHLNESGVEHYFTAGSFEALTVGFH